MTNGNAVAIKFHDYRAVVALGPVLRLSAGGESRPADQERLKEF